MNSIVVQGRRGLLRDSHERYGLVSRLLHWGMAYLLIWQFVSIALWRMFGGTDWVKAVTALGPGHGTVGLLTFVLVVSRAGWSFLNRRHRPSYEAGWMGRAARPGHRLLYGLMFAIPALALLRSYGSGKGWNLWGMPIIPQTGVEVGWMIAPANALHGVLAWLLCAAIAGRILMALFHGVILRDRTLASMAGSLKSASQRAA